MPNSMSVVHFLLVDFGWCDHPGDREKPSMAVHLVGDHPGMIADHPWH